jgi:lysophospholipase L1-like esterase
MIKVTKSFSTLALLALAANLSDCGGSGFGGAAGPVPVAGKTPPIGTQVTNRIVGLGDSLTFGTQSDAELGATTVSLAGYPQFTSIGLTSIPPTQENGWFSLFYSDAKSMTWLEQANPATSALPLIAGPGLGDQILPANPADTGGIPFAMLPAAIQASACDAFNQSAYSWSNAGSVRMNPSATTYDLGIPSLTIAEAIGMRQPLTTTCVELYNPPANMAQAELDGLQSLIGGESELFYPVMEHYATPANPQSPLQVAESLNPTLTTVWLGANDLIRFVFSGGTAPGVDTTEARVQKDMTTIIASLKHAGSNVIVATIPDLLETPQFAIVGVPASQAQCAYQTWLPCLLVDFGFSYSNAVLETEALESADTFLAPAGGQNAYLTEAGLLTLFLSGGNPASLTATENGSDYVTAAFAPKVTAVNTAINNGIVAAAQASGVPYVPIDQIYNGIYTATGAYFAEVASINPPKCCTLAFGGGIVSFDGLHPTDTGYAIVAQVFAQTANSAFGLGLPAINPASAYAGAGGIYAPYPDPYAQH